MPARQKMTPVEMMIVLAIIGILFSIAVPAMNQSQRRNQSARRAARPHAAAPQTVAPDGQLNTIQVSKLSRSAERRSPGQWIGVLLGLAPVIIAVAVILTVVRRFRQQMTHRRAH